MILIPFNGLDSISKKVILLLLHFYYVLSQLLSYKCLVCLLIIIRESCPSQDILITFLLRHVQFRHDNFYKNPTLKVQKIISPELELFYYLPSTLSSTYIVLEFQRYTLPPQYSFLCPHKTASIFEHYQCFSSGRGNHQLKYVDMNICISTNVFPYKHISSS